MRRAPLAALLLACAAPAAPAAERSAPRASAEPAAAARYGEERDLALAPAERRAVAAVRAGRARDLALSPALVLAARELARRAADGDPDPLALSALRRALARAGAHDPAPAAHLVSAAAGALGEALARSAAEGDTAPDATHLGAGAVVRDGRGFAAVLLARRTAALEPFPRAVAVGESATLAGTLLGLEAPRVHVAAPPGGPRVVRATVRGRTFRVPLRFDAPGRWLVEVVGTGPRGPEVAALLQVDCGAPAEEAPPEPLPADPPDLAAAERLVLARVDAVRRAQRLPPLEPSARLAEIARRHSREMLARGTLAHVLPSSGDVGDRLRRAGVPYALALENVARARSAAEAQRGVEDSPAHRENLLTREATQIGVGLARAAGPAGEPVVYLTQILAKPVEDGADDRLAPEARVREAVWRARADAGAAALTADPTLDALAGEEARAMLRRRDAGAPDAAQRILALGRKLAASDAFVVARTADAARSRHVADARFRRVGVGVAVGDSPRHGAGMLWVVVLYSD